MQKARFMTSWHGVPANTEVEIVREFMHFGIDRTFEVRRLDGKPLPGPFCESATAAVAPDFLDMLPA